ncbi:MAG: hypothetical protein ACYDC2_05045 [Solirubrobacteraceae bacterium]
MADHGIAGPGSSSVPEREEPVAREGEQPAAYGPLELRPLRKDDGRVLIAYRRALPARER